MPPISPTDREELRRLMREIAREEAEERARPIEQRASKMSGKFREIREEVSPAVARRISDSQHDLEDRSLGFERLILDSLTLSQRGVHDLNSRLVAIEKQGAAQLVEVNDGTGTKSMVPAAIVASNRIEGKTAAIQIAADSADKNSLAARVKAKQALIVVVAGVLIDIAYKAWSHIGHLVFP